MRVAIDALGMGMRDLNHEIRKHPQDEVIVRNASQIPGLGSGMRSGLVRVEGNAGDYLGMLNSGARFEVHGNCGRFLGDGMTSGDIVVHGDAGIGAGEYCYGGSIRIEGDAADFLGTMNKGGSIVVMGDARDDAATYMLSGVLVIMGSAGERTGNFLIGGRVYIMGEIAGLGANARPDRLASEDIDLLARLMEQTGVEGGPRQFRKFVPESARPFYGKKVETKGVG